jgi:hypothetical protein
MGLILWIQRKDRQNSIKHELQTRDLNSTERRVTKECLWRKKFRYHFDILTLLHKWVLNQISSSTAHCK